MTADAQNRHSAELRIPAGHPALPGHFPGNPIVPGVVILDEVISTAEAWLGGRFHVHGMPQAKFLALLKPDEKARIDLALNGTLLEFRVRRGDVTIAMGVFDGSDGPAQ